MPQLYRPLRPFRLLTSAPPINVGYGCFAGRSARWTCGRRRCRRWTRPGLGATDRPSRYCMYKCNRERSSICYTQGQRAGDFLSTFPQLTAAAFISTFPLSPFDWPLCLQIQSASISHSWNSRSGACAVGAPAGHLEKVRMETIACRARHYRCDLRASFFSNFLLSSNSVVSDPCASLKLIKSLSTCRGQGYNGMASMPCTRLRYSPDPCSAAHGHWQSPRQ